MSHRCPVTVLSAVPAACLPEGAKGPDEEARHEHPDRGGKEPGTDQCTGGH